MSPLWMGSCTSSGKTSICGRKSIIGSFHRNIPACVTVAYRLPAGLIMGMPSPATARTLTPANITPSHYFEKLCTRSRTWKPHGTFFSVVSRDIDELNVIMAGEVDCSTGMYFYSSTGFDPLTAIP